MGWDNDRISKVVTLCIMLPLWIYLTGLVVVVVRRLFLSNKKAVRNTSSARVTATKAQVVMVAMLMLAFFARVVEYSVWIGAPPPIDVEGHVHDLDRHQYTALVVFWIFHYLAESMYLLARVSLLSLFWDTLALLQRAVNMSHGVRGQVRSRTKRVWALTTFSCCVFVIMVEAIREAVTLNSQGDLRSENYMDIPLAVLYGVVAVLTAVTTIIFNRRSHVYFRRSGFDTIALQLLKREHKRRIVLGFIFCVTFIAQMLRVDAYSEGSDIKNLFYGNTKQFSKWARALAMHVGTEFIPTVAFLFLMRSSLPNIVSWAFGSFTKGKSKSSILGQSSCANSNCSANVGAAVSESGAGLSQAESRASRASRVLVSDMSLINGLNDDDGGDDSDIEESDGYGGLEDLADIHTGACGGSATIVELRDFTETRGENKGTGQTERVL